MKKLILLFIAFSVTLPFYGQDQKTIDSLLRVASSDVSKRDRVDSYVMVAYAYSGLDSVNSKLYIAKALEIAEDAGYKEGMADVWYVISRNSMLKGDYDKSEKDLATLMSLATELEYAKGSANGYYGLGWLSYYRGNYEESITYHTKSLEIRNRLKDKGDIANSLRGLGITHKLKGEFEQALDYLSQSLTIEQETANLGGMAESLNHIGIINGLRGYYGFAMDSYFRALDIQKEIGDKSGLAYTYQNIGVVYDQQQAYDKALEYYRKSLRLREQIGERRGVAQIIHNIGNVYHELDNYEEALNHYQDALQMKESLGDKRGVADGHLNIGRLFDDQGKHLDAIRYKTKSLKISDEINSDWGKVGALISLGRSYQGLREYNEAKEYLIEGIQLAKESKLIASVREGARLLAIVEKEMGHYKDAYEAQVLFQQMSDSLSNEETTKKITLLEAEYQFQQEKDSIQFINEREKLILDQKISAQRTMQLAALITVIVLIAIIGILYRYYQLKNESNRRLSLLNEEIKDQNESLSALNDEKNNLIGIVAHDLKNPLSGIITSVDLMGRSEWKNDEKLREIIQLTASRMLKMITEILDVEAIEKSADGIKIQTQNLSSVVSDVCDQMHEQAKDKNIEIQTSIEGNVCALIDERYTIQIVENLLSNAIKFSPPNKKVAVSLTEDRDQSILEVKDEGPGFTADDKKKIFNRFQRLSAQPTADEPSTGLGLSIVKKFVEGMGGTVWYESEFGKGASFFVAFQLAKN